MNFDHREQFLHFLRNIVNQFIIRGHIVINPLLTSVQILLEVVAKGGRKGVHLTLCII